MPKSRSLRRVDDAPPLDREDGAEKYSAQYLKRRSQQAVLHWLERGNRIASDAARPQMPPPEVLFDLKGKTAGQACSRAHGGSQIRINLDLLRRYPRQMIQNTIPHEMAHLVTSHIYLEHPGRIRPHGPEWKSVMAQFGRPADVTHTMHAQATRRVRRWDYTCRCPGKTHSITTYRHRRILRGAAYQCRLCRSRLEHGATPAPQNMNE